MAGAFARDAGRIEDGGAGMSYILVVDDDADHRELIRLVMGPAYRGMPVRLASSGEDALRVIEREGVPCLALVDVEMPGLDGEGTVKRIREQDEARALPIVMLSTSDDADDIRACLQAGANSYVRKPMALSEWGRTIGAVADYWLLMDASSKLRADVH